MHLACMIFLVSESLLAVTAIGAVPSSAMCPRDPILRTADQHLNVNEKLYVQGRQSLTSVAHKDYLIRNDSGLDVESFYNKLSKNVNIAIAISGGGYRSMFTSAGVLAALDYRTNNGSGVGNFGGFLQSSSYIAGISGGSWLVSSLIANDFVPISELVNDDARWNFEKPLLEGIPEIDYDSKKDSLESKRKGRLVKREFEFEDLEKRQLRESIRDRVHRFLAELNTLTGDITAYSNERVRSIIEKYGVDGITYSVSSVSSSSESRSTSSVSTSCTDSEYTEFQIDSSLIETESDTCADYETAAPSLTSPETLVTSTEPVSSEDEIRTSTTSSASTIVPSSSSAVTLPSSSLSSIINDTIALQPQLAFSPNAWQKVTNFYKTLHHEVNAKTEAGFKTTFTDYWARALTKKLFANVKVTTISELINSECFQNFEVPFPIFVVNSKWPDTSVTSLNSKILEFTLFEFGSWDSYLNAFANVKYIGSKLFNGIPTDTHPGTKTPICIEGFDDLAFITSSSSSLFNNALVYIWQAVMSANKKTSNAMKLLFGSFGLGLNLKRQSKNHPEFGIIAPNPFQGFTVSNAESEIINSTHLFVADGGEDKQNIPFHPFLQKAREVDLILAIDSTSDKGNYPNGTSLRATFDRYMFNDKLFNLSTVSYKHSKYSKLYHAHSTFPKVPTDKEVKASGLINKPMFLGCNLNSYPKRAEPIFKTKTFKSEQVSNNWSPPLIVYMPNSFVTVNSNVSTFKSSYNKSEVKELITNGYNMVTLKNLSIYEDFDKCLACATIKREFDRIELGMSHNFTGFQVPDTCTKCYAKFCYN